MQAYPFTATLTDADGVTATKALSITVNAKPVITTTTLPAVDQGQTTYSQTLTNTGGTSPLTWTETGALPSGLTLSSAGVISGTVSGTATVQAYPFTATLTDADGVTATQALSITVNAKPVITTTTLPAVDQGQTTYSQTLTNTGGTSPLTWTETGALPSGLTLSSAGVISGTVSGTATVQAYPFTATLTDANGVTATQALSITVNAKPTITPTTLPTATLTGTYSQQLAHSGGTSPFGNWTETGALPERSSLQHGRFDLGHRGRRCHQLNLHRSNH